MSESQLLRLATMDDVPALTSLIEAATLSLASDDYSESTLRLALKNLLAVDPQLVEDQTYFLIEDDGEPLACGGWTFRATVFGGDQLVRTDSRRLDPSREAAKLRAFFVRPSHARQGLGSRLLTHCEAQARAAGFSEIETGATLPGVRLYRERGYRGALALNHRLPNGEEMRIVPMHKTLD